MAQKWDKSLNELKAFLSQNGITGSWVSNDTTEQFKTPKGGVLNYFSSTRNINFQGQADEKKKLAAAFMDSSEVQNVGADNGVFLVYGHDDEARRDVELFLHNLGIKPYVMQRDAKVSELILTELEKNMPLHKFGVVLMTPDDFGYAKTKDGKSQSDKDRESRARQNVILELGMLLGRLGRKKVAILVKGHLEYPSDINNMLYIPYNDKVIDSGQKLISILIENGFKISQEQQRSAMSG